MLIMSELGLIYKKFEKDERSTSELYKHFYVKIKTFWSFYPSEVKRFLWWNWTVLITIFSWSKMSLMPFFPNGCYR